MNAASRSPAEARAPARAPARARDGAPLIFDHEKLDVYQAAVTTVEQLEKVASDLPKGRGYLADQLRRAAVSIPLNIAEGAGESSAREKARFYRIARRSGTECAALLDVVKVLEPATANTAGGRASLVDVVSMLVRLCQSLERRAARGSHGQGHGQGHGHGEGGADAGL